ncbi:MAG: class I SAM-dependent methyltransferase [Chitinophagales bacterium]|nr:class I SAM-dependent methyltransferase [Chitinophagales bacterium]
MNNTPKWYEVWFDSPYYPILYKDRNEEEASQFIDKITAWLEIPQDSKIFDLACGRGRHSHHLAQKGYTKVIGIDIAEKSINFASSQYQCDNLDFYIHDMRLPFRINYFDYTFNFFTSFGYFKNLRENQAVISSICKGLKPGGRAMIDFMNVEKVIDNLVEREEKVIDNIHFYIRRYVENNILYKTIKVDDGTKVSMFSEEVQILKPVHFYQMIQAESFKLVKEFGDYQLHPFDPKTSDRYILIIEKIAND